MERQPYVQTNPNMIAMMQPSELERHLWQTEPYSLRHQALLDAADGAPVAEEVEERNFAMAEAERHLSPTREQLGLIEGFVNLVAVEYCNGTQTPEAAQCMKQISLVKEGIHNAQMCLCY